MDFKSSRQSRGFLKFTKILMVRSLIIKYGDYGLVYMPYFIPTINFNMLQCISSNDLLASNPLQVSNHCRSLSGF